MKFRETIGRFPRRLCFVLFVLSILSAAGTVSAECWQRVFSYNIPPSSLTLNAYPAVTPGTTIGVLHGAEAKMAECSGAFSDGWPHAMTNAKVQLATALPAYAGGSTFKVMNTTGAYEFGISIKVRDTHDPQGFGWKSVTAGSPLVTTFSSMEINIGLLIDVTLTATTSLPAGVYTIRKTHIVTFISDGNVSGPYQMPIYFGDFTVTVNTGSCNIDSVTVPMGDHSLATTLKTVGAATTPAVPFKLEAKGCPASLGSLKYQITPGNGIDTNYPTVAKLDGTSGSATGVGVQLLDATTSNALSLSVVRSFPTKSGTTFTDNNLKAQYRRTGAITAGKANAKMTVTLVYP